jgi:glycosyltransferase involved in cell wall biosynthesis
MSNYLDEFEVLVNENIDSGKLNDALTKIVNFVESIMNDKRSLAKIYGSPTLDRLCQQIGAITLNNKICNPQIESFIDNKLVVYIATELYITGGHTAVIEDLIKSQPEKKHLILLTDIFHKGQNEAIRQRFLGLPTDIEWAIQGNYLDKLWWLQDKLISYQPKQVFVLNHHQDAVAIASVQQNIPSEFVFYHHADYLICLGLYLDFVKHIDAHAFCYGKCKSLGVKNTVFIPLMVEDFGRCNETTFLQESRLRTCSSGHWSKYNTPYLYSYIDIVPEILSVTGGVHVHIGDMPDEAIDNIQTELKKKGIKPDSFIYIPWVKSVWEAMQDHRIDLYINSFPIGGSKAVVEVMGSGTPVLGHQNYNSYLLSYAHTIYPEAFFWSKPEELYNCLSLLNGDILTAQASFARKHYENYHVTEIFVKSIRGLETGNPTISPPLMTQYPRDELRSYFDDFKQFQSELQNAQSELQNAQSELEQLQNIVVSMQTSKFWKLRDNWFKLKRLFVDTQISNTSYVHRKDHKTFAFISGCPGDSYRYRCQHQSEMLVIMGYSVEVYQPNVFPYEELLNTYKVVVAHRVAYTPDFASFIFNANKLGIKVIFDIDDLVFDLSRLKQIDAYRKMNEAEKKLYKDGVSLYRKSLSLCKYIVVSTDKLRQEVQVQFPDKKAIVSRNRVSEEMALLAATAQESIFDDDNKLRIAYFSGTKTHTKDFGVCVSALRTILKEFHHVHLMVVGHLDLPEVLHEFTPQIETISFVKWQNLPDLYRKVSVNLAPLEFNNDFTESKSELKYFEAALLRVPTIASNLGAFCVAIKDNINGRLCTTTLEWENALRELIIDTNKRKELGQKAFEDVYSRYLTRVAASKTVESWKHLIEEDLPPK